MNKTALVTDASSGIGDMGKPSTKGTALITGASRGIGAVYADRLAKRGYDLILVARSVAPLQALAATLSRSTGRRTTPIVADVNNRQDLARVEAKLKDDPSITMLVNNAGFASVAPLLDADIEKMEEMIALNIIALTRLTYAAAPAFVKRGTGTIINIGSAAGISVEAMNGVYGASKAYVLAFSLSLQHELTSKGIRVQVVLPGRTATDGWDVAGGKLHMELTNVTFSTTNGYFDVHTDTNGAAYATPHWQTNRSHPALFVSGSRMAASCNFDVHYHEIDDSINGMAGGFPENIVVQGGASSGHTFWGTNGATSPGFNTAASTTLQSSRVDFFNPLTIDWNYAPPDLSASVAAAEPAPIRFT